MPKPAQTYYNSKSTVISTITTTASSRKNSTKQRTPCNGKRDGDKDKEDGSEFGLVPRYILKKSGRNVVRAATGTAAAGGGTNPSISSNNNGNNDKMGMNETTRLTAKDILSPPRIKRQEHHPHHQQFAQTPTTISSEASSSFSSNVMVPSEEEIARLMDETDALLEKKWFISQWTKDTTIGFRQEKELLLRTEGWDPQNAARRIEDHIKTKVELFKLFGNNNDSTVNGGNNDYGGGRISSNVTSGGIMPSGSFGIDDPKAAATTTTTTTATSLMGKRISLYDIGKVHKTQVGIEDGYVQLVPTRDLQGRAILFFHFDAKLFGQQPQLFRKFLYYMTESALEDDETADKGIVLVVWNDDPAFLSILDPFWQPNVWSKIRMPYRIAKLHYCQRVHDSTPYSVQEKRDRGIDLVIHQGSLHEIMHGLITYSVPAHFLPLNTQLGGVSNTGTRLTHEDLVENSNHLRWIELRRRIESLPIESQEVIVLVPSRNDVLLGKNRKTSMPGNVFYHQQVAAHLEAYHLATTDLERDAICFEVYTAVADTHGRFLQLVEDVLWEDLDQQNAQRIIRMAFNYLLTGSTESGDSSSENQRCTHNEYDPFDFRDIFNVQQCWNLMHCKVGAPKGCW